MWKTDHPELLSNFSQARKRLLNLNSRLSEDLGNDYDAVFREREASGIIEEVPEAEVDAEKVFYLPHRPVVREMSSSTKVRPVFDASAAGYNGISLNDCLDCGPALVPNVVDLILRFRRWRVALVADIAEAFPQIGLRVEDRDVHRFLWKQGDRLRVMRFLRVTFGENCSPFLLNATIRHHLEGYNKKSSDQWWKGPSWLTTGEFPSGVSETRASDVLTSVEAETRVVLISVEPQTCVFSVNRWSTYKKAVRIVAWVGRFISLLRMITQHGQLTVEELKDAECVLIRDAHAFAFSSEIGCIQAGSAVPNGSSLRNLNPMIDENGLIRFKGRLQNDDLAYSARHPVILPKGHLSLIVARDRHLELNQAGVGTLLCVLRESFWIVGRRRLVKGVKKACVVCRRFDSSSGPLPADRVRAAPPFD